MKLKLIVTTITLTSMNLQATIIASDNFSYPDGQLTGQNGGTGFSGPYTSYSKTSYQITNGIVSGSKEEEGHGGNFRVLNNPFGNSGIIWGTIDFAFKKEVNIFGGLSFFTGNAEKVLIGDRSNSDTWDISVPFGRKPYSSTKISNYNVVRTGVFRITLGAGATSVIDLWIGNDDFTPVDVSGTAHATLSNLELEGVDTIRLASGINQILFDDFILATTPEEVGAVLVK